MAPPHLLSLPPEIIQSIHLHSLSPSLPRASPILASAISTTHIYKHTFLSAFWTHPPLSFAGPQPQPPCTPGPHVRALFQPLPVPNTPPPDAHARIILQNTVLRYRWCTFDRLKRFFSDALSAITTDLLLTLHLPLSPHDQSKLTSFLASLPPSRSSLKLSSPDTDSDNTTSLTLLYPRPFVTALLLTLRGPKIGADPRFDPTVTPNLTLAPTAVLALPAHVLAGNKPKWSREGVELLQMLASFVHLGDVSYEREALEEGLRNAVAQRCAGALRVLLWLSGRLAEGQRRGGEVPGELFRIVAGREREGGCGNLHAETSVEDREFEIDIELFALLIGAHAESMPRHDPVIESWARSLLSCRAGGERGSAFARWVLDWSQRDQGGEVVAGRRGFRRREGELVRGPLFSGGRVSRERRADEMARRFVEIWGGVVRGFGEEVEGGGEM